VNPLWLARRSVELDLRTLAFSPWPIGKRVGFVARKYQVLARRSRFRLGDSSVRFSGETIYYDSPLGLTGYQSMLTRHANLLRVAGIGNFKTVIDCGANVGFFTKMIKQVAPRARVYAIEPVPAIFRCLERNVGGTPGVEVFQLAISDRAGSLRMSFDSGAAATSHIADEGNVEVSAVTLDDFAAAHGITGDVDLLKVDTESFEAHVLRGATNVLGRTKNLLIEITIEGNENYSLSSLMSLLVGPGFDFQLAAFRNYADVAEGKMPIMDCLMVNRVLDPARRAAVG
jgi:FkbM family methyltransferase